MIRGPAHFCHDSETRHVVATILATVLTTELVALTPLLLLTRLLSGLWFVYTTTQVRGIQRPGHWRRPQSDDRGPLPRLGTAR